jgi:hypothetical protein
MFVCFGKVGHAVVCRSPTTLDLMNLSQIEELMAANFPWVEGHECDWENVHDGEKPKLEAIARLIETHIRTSEVLVLVLAEPDVGGVMSTTEAPAFIGNYVLKGRIHIADAQFSGFVVIVPTGVATGWRKPG